MNNENKRSHYFYGGGLVIGIATVTSDGIIFWDEAYSAGIALRESWYQANVCFLVEVVSISPKQQQIIINIEGKRCVCNKLPKGEQLSAPEITVYHKAIESLKQQLLRRHH